jgi:type VI secretion system secreted protein VgrG
MAELQAERAVEIFTPLGDDVLLFHRMTATEALGRLFRFDLDLLSKDPNIKFEDLLGQNVTVRLELPQDKTRYFNGFVSRFSLSGSLGDLSAYTVTVHPWLWFLTRTADCRIFQEMIAPDIIKQVFRDHGFTDFEEALSGSYRKWTYCVQYRETDFNFVSRLMEQEGIYYYFKHEKDKNTLVLSDSVSSHEAFPGYEKIPFFPPDEHLRREEHHIHDWTVSQEVQPGIYALNDYDFERPKANLQVKSSIQRGHARAKMEIFDYPGEYTQTGDGETYVRARIEELQAEYEQVQGQSNARGLCVGSLFQLVDYPREDQNREYLVVSATHELESDAYTSGLTAEVEDVYSCSFTALDSKQPYRQPRTTPKPMVQGPQTAVVVGPAGEEICTDKYGRVKIQFHWDRYGKNDENSSCWVRVSHPTAGKGWGAVQIPRIGQEVIVEFLEGDPDQPIITGRVYNANQMPPFELPGAGMVSGMKSNSTPGGGGYNEMSMNDTKGEEGIIIHGQYDMNTTVEHDQTNTVNNDFAETIKNNATIKITDGNYSHDVMTGTADYHVQSALTEKYDATQETTVKGNLTVKSTTGAIAVSADAAHVMIDAATKITLHTGASTIEMDAGGNIKIDGVNITINGAVSVAIKGTMVNSEASAQHQTKGAIVISEGSATNTVKGGTVLLNP